MAKTIAQLRTEAQTIKNAIVVGENTATRVGGTIEDVVDYLDESSTYNNDIMPIDSKFDNETALYRDYANKIIRAGIWSLRYTNNGNAITEGSDADGKYYQITLDRASGVNPSLWCKDIFRGTIGKDIHFVFDIKLISGVVTFLLGSSSNEVAITTPSNTWIHIDMTKTNTDQYGDDRMMFYDSSGCTFQIKNLHFYLADTFVNKINELDFENQFFDRHLLDVFYTGNIPNTLNRIGRNVFEQTGVMNIGMFGDSWTQGVTANGVTGLISYVKYIARILWEKYGFGGHGWYDFGYSNNTYLKCADDEAFSFSKSGTVTYSSRSASSLGVAICHAIFASGASYTLTLTDSTHPIDKAVIWYYNDAAFTYSVNGGAPVSVTADSSSGWQSVTINENITTIQITATAANSIIFGIDFSYGSRGVKVHKFGNRGLTTGEMVAVNSSVWSQGLSKFNLDMFTCLMFTNDLLTNVQPYNVVNNIATLFDRVDSAYNTIDKVIVTPSELKNGLGLYSVDEYNDFIKVYALKKHLPYIALKPIFGTPYQINQLGTFIDQYHPSKMGDYLIAEHLFKYLFEYYQYKDGVQ